MEQNKLDKAIKILAGYYGVLQSLHALSLARAGWLLLKTGRLPFPAPPPTGGWPASSLPFLLGMGMVDLFAISLALVFVVQLYRKGEIIHVVGIISLTIALSSGVVYLVGTLPSGAWQANLLAYLVVLLVFSPLIPLFAALLLSAGSMSRKI